MRQAGWLLALGLLLGAAAGAQAKGRKKADGELPDTAFAAVERGAQGQKVRRLPYRDSSGRVDPARLRSALRQWKRVKWLDPSSARQALATLQSAKSQLCAIGQMKCGKGRAKKAKA